MARWLRGILAGRPAWMNALMLFCAFMAFVYVPWDFLVKPAAEDAEVWFGIMLRGGLAKATEPLHAAIYAAGFYGFLRMRPWMFPWAAVYVAQIAIGMLVWGVFYGEGARGPIFGALAFVAFAALAVALWRAEPRFSAPRAGLRERYGEWALVTGASAGIGAEFARALAREGLSLVLTARRGERLEALAHELEQTHSVATKVVVEDLSIAGGAERLADAVADLPLALLVNNAGFGYAGRFEKLDPERLRAQVELNCVAPVVLTRRLLPGLCERGRGAVIVVGSVAGRQPLPLHAVYSATKAFDLLFGEALCVELADQGIDVLVLEPGSTETEFQTVAGELPHAGETAAQVVEVALRALGRQPSVVSGWFNWLRACGVRLFPRGMVVYSAHDVMARQTPEGMR